ncbi:MAG: hypothetical protein ABI550_02430 [Ignavibacteriaceae bacterium]
MKNKLIYITMFILMLLAAVSAQTIVQNQKSVTNYWVEYPFPDAGSNKIYFSKSEESKHTLYTVDSSGNESQINLPGLSVRHVCVHPNGESIAFTGINDEVFDIYVMELSSGKIKNLTNTKEIEFHPKYSSDGKLLIFNRQQDTLNFFSIVYHELSNGKETTIFNDTISRTFASLSPDNSKIAAVQWHPNMNTEIFISDADGSNQKNISKNESFDGWPCWSTDGKKIVFSSDREEKFKFQLYEYDIENNNLKRIMNDEFSYVQPIYNGAGEGIIAVKSYKRGFPNQIVKIFLQKDE